MITKRHRPHSYSGFLVSNFQLLKLQSSLLACRNHNGPAEIDDTLTNRYLKLLILGTEQLGVFKQAEVHY